MTVGKRLSRNINVDMRVYVCTTFHRSSGGGVFMHSSRNCLIGWSEFYLIFWIWGVKTLGFGAKNNHESNFGPPTLETSFLHEVKGLAGSIFGKIARTSLVLVRES